MADRPSQYRPCALCAAVVHRAEVADHLAELVVGSPVGAVEIVGLTFGSRQVMARWFRVVPRR